MILTDTHTHLLDERFEENRQQITDRLDQDGLAFIIECGTDVADSRKAVELARHQKIYCAVGVHPHSAGEYSKETDDIITELSRSQKVVAIGEIGLDFHYDFSPRDIQEKAFAAQIALAKKLNLPVVVHSREASDATFQILSGSGVRGELHCFSGSAEMALRYVEKGFYIAFGGSLTFKNARKTVEAAHAVPMERILIETDCPYLAPEPMRGKTNQPAYVRYVAEKLAEIKGCTAGEIAQITKKNATELFSITED